MKEKEINIIKSILGDDIFEALEKNEGGVFKENTKTVTNTEDIKIALQIVPRAVLSWLFSNLKWRDVGDVIDLEIPFANGKLQCTKLSPDNYSGEIISEGGRAARFKYRSLPSIGLVLMSTFELYDIAQLDVVQGNQTEEHEDRSGKLQDIIDERLRMHSLINSVVDKRITEREAIDQLIRSRLNQSIVDANKEENEEEAPMEHSKKSRLREFMDNRKKKAKESIELDKSEEISCPDCSSKLYKSEGKYIKLCICFGDHMGKEIKISKSENGRVNLKIPKELELGNIEMLRDIIKK